MSLDFRESYPVIQWDLNRRILQKHYIGSVGDSGNGYKVMILQDGDILTPTTEEVYFYFEKHDKTHGYIKAEIIDNMFIVDLTNQVFAVAGNVSCNFQIKSGTRWKTSPEFIIKVDKNNIQDSIESSDDFIAFQEAINNLAAITDSVNTAISNTNTATQNAITATENAITATNAANEATDNAITATTNANTATNNANTATSNANIATTNANNAANLANEKAGLANMAAINANNVATQLSNETLKIYKGAVVSYSDLATTYPNPENGWTVTVSSESASYRYNGTEWINLGVISSVGTATDTTLGVVKGGGNINVAIDGTINVNELGDLSTLGTTNKSTLVEAINEVNSQLADNAKHLLDWYNVLMFEVDKKGEINCSPIIQSIINSYIDGEVVLYFPEGRYRVDAAIKLNIKTRIVGAGTNKTVFIAPNGNNIFEVDLTPPEGSNILSGATIKDLTILGCDSSLTQRGIYVYNNRSASVTYPAEVRTGIFQNLYIDKCGIGVYIGQKVAFYTYKDIMINACHDTGLYNLGTDAIFDGIRIHRCKNGAYVQGGNLIFSNCKICWSGVCRHGEDYRQTYGARFSADRLSMVNIDIQENFSDGIIFHDCHNLNLSGLNVDSNGYGKEQVIGADYGGNGVIIDNCYNVIGNINADDFHQTPTQVYGLEIKSNCRDINLNYTETNQVNKYSDTNAVNVVVRLPEDEYLKRQLEGDLVINNLIASKDYDSPYFSISGGITYSQTDGELTVNTSNVSFGHIKYTGGNIATGINPILIPGHKYAFVTKVKADVGYGYSTMIWDNTTNTVVGLRANFTGNGDYQNNVLIFTAPTTGNILVLDIVDFYEQTSTQRKTMYIKELVLIDLTTMGLEDSVIKHQSVVSRFVTRLIDSSKHKLGMMPIGLRAILKSLQGT